MEGQGNTEALAALLLRYLHTSSFAYTDLGAPKSTGLIRQQPSDFRVIEKLGFEPEGQGEHLFLWVEKENANTGWVANQLATTFGLRHFDVSYAGKKDRHAITRQWFSAYLPRGVEAKQLEAAGEIEGIQILKQCWHKQKLRRGDHLGNAFEIWLRDLEIKDEDLEQRLVLIKEFGCGNFFGQQRFGTEAGNLYGAERLFHLVAEGANDKQLRQAGLNKKNREMLISAARSFLFNVDLSNKLASIQGGLESQREELLGKDGWLYGLNPHRDITVPSLCEPLSHWQKGLCELGLKAMARPYWLQPEEMTWQFNGSDLYLSFNLPSGSFATTIIAELIQVSKPEIKNK